MIEAFPANYKRHFDVKKVQQSYDIYSYEDGNKRQPLRSQIEWQV